MQENPKAFFFLYQDVKKTKKRICSRAAGRTGETFQDLLAWPAADELFLPEVKEKRRSTQNTQAKTTEILYVLEVVTSVFLYKAQRNYGTD